MPQRFREGNFSTTSPSAMPRCMERCDSVKKSKLYQHFSFEYYLSLGQYSGLGAVVVITNYWHFMSVFGGLKSCVNTIFLFLYIVSSPYCWLTNSHKYYTKLHYVLPVHCNASTLSQRRGKKQLTHLKKHFA